MTDARISEIEKRCEAATNYNGPPECQPSLEDECYDLLAALREAREKLRKLWGDDYGDGARPICERTYVREIIGERP